MWWSKVADFTPECPKSQQVFFGVFFSKPFLDLPCPILLSHVSYPLVKHTHARFQCNIQMEWNYMHSMINEQWFNLYSVPLWLAFAIMQNLSNLQINNLWFPYSKPPPKKSTAKWFCHVAVNIWRNFGAFHLVQQTQGWLPLKTLAFSCICWAKIDTHRLQSTQNCWQGATFTSCNGCIVANGIWQNLPRYFWSNSLYVHLFGFGKLRLSMPEMPAVERHFIHVLYAIWTLFPRILPSLRFKVSYSPRAPYLPPCCAACTEQVAIPSTWRKHSWPWKIWLEQLLGLVIQENNGTVTTSETSSTLTRISWKLWLIDGSWCHRYLMFRKVSRHFKRWVCPTHPHRNPMNGGKTISFTVKASTLVAGNCVHSLPLLYSSDSYSYIYIYSFRFCVPRPINSRSHDSLLFYKATNKYLPQTWPRNAAAMKGIDFHPVFAHQL